MKQKAQRVAVPEADIMLANDTLSEFDVLNMDDHDAYYGKGQLAKFPGLPVGSSWFVSSKEKSSSSNVVGNIGEALGIATVATVLNASVVDALRIKRQRVRMPMVARRTPDFIMNVPGMASSLKSLLDPQVYPTALLDPQVYPTALANFPDRFPIECKAAGDNANGAFWGGLWQLMEYWHTAETFYSGAADVGYGLVVCVSGVRRSNRKVQLFVLAPKDRSLFAQTLMNLTSFGSDRESFENAFGSSGGSPFVEKV